ncbi:hypothetical protein FA09DRAFT_331841 [Tilletiopsis washingtonensis]|uniref:Uncharacterized protein n=1 Tax=Tilletiopsis washingtonensis TaxID=58919 RepID=A0A316Z6Q5_9BASI|nr:hypothetical protein FA09DRAFT_331841 [Tilletiopsis washingtonensis]PWN95905.1 hypothetical protein FA09DRAFT_331841 [Tilletiopsis washingtonensis]
MALNWAMLSDDGARPVPLPNEKILCSIEHCQLSLDFKHQGVKWEARGNAVVSNQRVLFLRQPALPAPLPGQASSAHLRSLSVPLRNFVDTRYLIPIFAAPYYEAHVLPVRDGGLPQHVPGAPATSGLAKIWFNEGGGTLFKEAVEEAKARAEIGGAAEGHLEALPTYSPPPPGSSAAANESIAALSPPTRAAPLAAAPSASAAAEPAAEDLEAAAVARQEEEAEAQAWAQETLGAAAPSAAGDAGTDELPPGYAEACEPR